MAVDTIIAKFELQTAQAQAALAEMNKRLDATEAELKQVSAQSKKTGDAMDASAKKAGSGFLSLKDQLVSLGATMGVVFGAQEIISFARNSISAAADLGETLNKVGVIFGQNAGEIEAWADTAAQRLGQSKQQALDAASTFAIFGKSAGLTGSDLSGFSVQMTELASDLASFNNTSPEEAIEAIGAALRGEAEPIRKYGVLLDDAALRQEALSQGLIKTTKEALTPQQKVLAAQGAILKQTTLAQGDFANTADSLSNKQKILTAEFANFQTELGQRLAPTFEKIVDGSLELIKSLDPDNIIAFAKAVGIAGAAFGAWKLGSLIPMTGSFANSISVLTTRFKAFTAALRANPIGLIAAGITLAVGAIIAFGDETEEATEAQQKLAESIKGVEENGAKEVAMATQVFRALQKTTAGTKEREEGIRKINEQYGTNLKNLQDEAAFQTQVADALDRVVAGLKEKIAMQVQETRYADVIQRQVMLTENLQKAQKQLQEAEREIQSSAGDANAFAANAAQSRLAFLRGQVKSTETALEMVNQELKTLDETTKTIVTSLDSSGGDGGEAARKAADERLKALEQAEAEIRKINDELLREVLGQQESERLAVELKYKAQLDEARKYANDITAEGRRWAAVEASLKKAANAELEAIDEKYRMARFLRDQALRQKEIEALRQHQSDRLEFIESREESYVSAYDKEANALLTAANNQTITWEEYYKRIGELDAKYSEEAAARGKKNIDDKQKLIDEQQRLILESTQLFGETLTNIMQITAGNSKAFADFQKFVALAELAVNKGIAISNAVAAISKGGLTPIQLIASIATITASVTAVFAQLANTINQSQTPEVPEFECYATGTAYLERNGAPKGIDTIPVMANEGEAIIPTGANAAAPGLAKAWIDGNLDDYIFRNYVIPALEEQAAEAAAKRMEAMSLSQAHVAGFDDFRLYVQSKKQVGYLEQIATNTKRAGQTRKRFYS